MATVLPENSVHMENVGSIMAWLFIGRHGGDNDRLPPAAEFPILDGMMPDGKRRQRQRKRT